MGKRNNSNITEEDLEAGESTGDEPTEKTTKNSNTKKEKTMKTKKTAKKTAKKVAKKESAGRPKSVSGKFKNSREFAESLFSKNSNLTSEDFGKAFKKEFPKSAAATNSGPHFSWYKHQLISLGDWKYSKAPKSKVKAVAKIKKTA